MYQSRSSATKSELSALSLVIFAMSQYHLIYDDNCPLCRGSIEKVRKFDKLGLVNCLPLSAIPDRSGCGLLGREKLLEEIHLVTPEKKVYRGADAVGILASLFPNSRYLGALILAPGIRVLARHVYRVVARHRLSLSKLVSLN